MNNATARQMIGRRAADLPVANHDVIMTGANGINAQLPQEQQFHIDEAVEGKAYIVFRRHKGEHDIRPISIDAPSPTFPAYHVDMVLSTFTSASICWFLPKMTVGSTCHIKKQSSASKWRATYSSIARKKESFLGISVFGRSIYNMILRMSARFECKIIKILCNSQVFCVLFCYLTKLNYLCKRKQHTLYIISEKSWVC